MSKGMIVTNYLLSYSEAEDFNADLFFYDHDLSERDLEKSPRRYHCLYCDKMTKRTEPHCKYLFVCEHCGWWQLISGGGGYGLKTCKLHRGLLKEYSLDSLDAPLNELRAFLRKHPSDVAHVNPTVFERLMEDCLRDKYDSCEVFHVGGTADRRIDLILIKSNEGPRLIQVKRRSDLSSTEGVNVVRELNGVLFRDNVAKGMVITTASRFTKPAIDETTVWTQTGQTYDMKLLSYSDVVELFDVKPRRPHEPWLRFLETGKE